MKVKNPERERKVRQELYAVSVRAFLRDGYEGATMKALAEEAGCTTGRFYCYFSGKQEILCALMTELFEKNKAVSDRLAAKRQDAPYGAAVFADLLFQGAALHENLRELYRQGLSEEAGRKAFKASAAAYLPEGITGDEAEIRMEAAARIIPVFLSEEQDESREGLFLTMLLMTLGCEKEAIASYIGQLSKDEKSIREKAYDTLVKILQGRKRRTTGEKKEGSSPEKQNVKKM